MGVLKEHGGIFYVNIVAKLISFGANEINVFLRSVQWCYLPNVK
jgi:hypothetical protein